MIKKHLLPFLLLIILAVLLVGCGKPGDNAGQTGDIDRSGDNALLTPSAYWMNEWGIDVNNLPEYWVLDEESGGIVEKTRLYLTLEDGAEAQTVQAAVEATGCTWENDLGGLIQVKLADGVMPWTIRPVLAELAGVKHADFNVVAFAKPLEPVEDDIDNRLTSYVSDDPRNPECWPLEKIQAYDAWDLERGHGTLVSIMDTGIMTAHEDLAAKIHYTSQGIFYDWWTGEWTYNDDIEDEHMHGTHVSGITAGIMDNGVGIAGVSGESWIQFIKAGRPNGSNWSISSIEFWQGIQWATKHGAIVINHSFGGGGRPPSFIGDIAEWAKAEGTNVVVAGGNSNYNLNTRSYVYSSEPRVFGVAATDSSDNGASFTNYGDVIDVAAPGVSYLSCYIDGGYAAFNGTSMAAPCASGCLSVIRSYNREITADQAEQILVDSGDPLTHWKLTGKNRVNIYNALMMAPPPRPTTPWDVTATDGMYFDKVVVTWVGGERTDGFEIWRSVEEEGTYRHLDTVDTETTMFRDEEIEPGTTYWYKVRAFGIGGNSEWGGPDSGYAQTYDDPDPIPDPPNDLYATDGTYADYVSIDWDTSLYADSYDVYRSVLGEGIWTMLGNTEDHVWLDYDAGQNVYYRYAARARNESGVSDMSEPDTGYRTWVVPGPPLTPVASDGTYTDAILFSWEACAGADGYEVWYGDSPVGSFTQLADVSTNSYMHEGLEMGEVHFYKVLAYNAGGDGPFSSIVRGWVNYNAPADLVATDGDYHDRVLVSWDESTGYDLSLWRADAADGTYTELTGDAVDYYTDLSVTPDQMYYYKGAYTNGEDMGPFSAVDMGWAETAEPEPPATPENLWASDGEYSDGVHLSWDPVPGVDSYAIYIGTDIDSPMMHQKDLTDTSALSVMDLDTVYYYWVVAVLDGIPSEMSVPDTGFYSLNLPDPPEGLECSQYDFNDRIELSWDPAEGATSYRIYASNESPLIYRGTTTGTTFTDFVNGGQTWWYKVSSVNDNGEGDMCDPEWGATGIDAPSFLTASDGDYASYTQVQWTSVSGGTQYYVYRSESSNGAYSMLGSTSGTTYNDGSGYAGITYYYKVKAGGENDEISEFSPYDAGWRGFDGGFPPPAPGDVDVQATGGYNVVVLWEDVPTADYYQIYRASSEYGKYTMVGRVFSPLVDFAHSVPADGQWWYKVKAFNDSGASGWSEKVYVFVDHDR